jgi:hypothetical protein
MTPSGTRGTDASSELSAELPSQPMVIKIAATANAAATLAHTDLCLTIADSPCSAFSDVL